MNTTQANLTEAATGTHGAVYRHISNYSMSAVTYQSFRDHTQMIAMLRLLDMLTSDTNTRVCAIALLEGPPN